MYCARTWKVDKKLHTRHKLNYITLTPNFVNEKMVTSQLCTEMIVQKSRCTKTNNKIMRTINCGDIQRNPRRNGL